MKKILVTGKTSRFAKFLKLDAHYPDQKQFNILDETSMNVYVKDKKFTHLIHVAGLSRPMQIHQDDIIKSINLNIIGTCNVVKVCKRYNIKLIYFSTSYVYPGTTGNYKETDPVYPVNAYAWSKLGGEAAVQMYDNRLILRLAMTEYPFIHEHAIKDAYASFMYNKHVAEVLPFLLDETGILNVGGPRQEIYEFAKQSKDVKPIEWKEVKNFPKDTSIDVTRFRNLIKEKHYA